MIPKETLQEIAVAAVAAPSVDNCQPWRLQILDDGLVIHLDRERASFFGDYAFTASYVTIGCMIENIAVAASLHNLQSSATLFPEGTNGPVVTISFVHNDSLVADPLAAHLHARCTNRRPYRAISLKNEDMLSLQTVILPPNGCLKLFTDKDDMMKLFRLSADVDSVIFSHPLLHENLFKWIRWNNEEMNATKDGMPLSSLELDIFVRQFFRMLSSWKTLSVLNRLSINRLIGFMNSSLLLRSSAVGLIVMESAEYADFVEGGRFLERVWLTAQANGLAFQPFGGMPFLLTRILRAGSEGFDQKQYELLNSVYTRLQSLTGINNNNALIMLFRTGYAPSPSGKTLRRPLSQVLV